MANLSDMMGLSPEQSDIATKLRMAEMLRSQSMQPSQGQMVSGHYVAPSALQGIAKLLGTYKAGKLEKEAGEASKAYGEQQRADFGDTAQKYFQALQGTPEKAEAYQADNPFGENLGNLQTVTPAKPGSQNDALLVALQSKSPQWQQIAMQNMAQQAKKTPRDQFGAIMPADFTTESLAKFQASGNYGDLIPVKGKANFGNVNPGQFTPESLAVYSQSGNYADLVPRFAPVTQDIGGAKVTYDPGSGRELKRYEVGLKPGEMPGVLAAQEAAKGAAKEQVRREAEKVGKEETLASDAQAIDSIAAEADKLLNDATGSTIGTGVALGKSAFGISDKSTRANASLKVLGGQLVAKIPKMSGPQSDADVKLYREMAGRIADTTVPVADRRAALQTLQNINRKYANQSRPAGQPQRQAPSKPAPAVKFLGFE